MDRKCKDATVLDLVEGNLSQREQEKLLETIRGDEHGKSSLAAFNRIATLESVVSSEEFALSDEFADEVMQKLGDGTATALEQDLPCYTERLQEAFSRLWEFNHSGIVRASAALATLVVIIGLTIHSTKSIQSPPIDYGQSTGSLTNGKNIQRVDASESRVDVVLTYSEKGKMTSKVIVPNVRLVNSSGYSTLVFENPSDKQGGVMTLDVTPKESHSIKSALEVGTVSFLFYG